ncbi:MAG: sigma-70 family RNA polymerase sigma factor [Planctomycetes bacterium]|nr:sigma-70 family RNA polymerase sigma factor [Planctomycetota bacterium]MCB9920447.1 sigma-70 family RNA polymerase sigma factor [Planctomycetota bacterium]
MHDDTAIEAVLRCVETRLRNYVDTRLGAQLRTRLRDSDVLQNAYVEMLRSLPEFVGDTEAQFVAWVTAIIENDIRRQRRWFGALKRQAPDRTSERNVLARTLLDAPTTPSAAVSQIEEKRLLAAALQRLPDHYREILELVVLQGLSHEDAAERMQRNPKASRMLLSRARAALSLEIEKLELGDMS